LLSWRGIRQAKNPGDRGLSACLPSRGAGLSAKACALAALFLGLPAHGGMALWQAGLAADADNAVLKRFDVNATQGVAVDARYFYAISNTEIVKRDKETGAAVATWRPDTARPADASFLHLNGGTVVDGRLYAAHSRYGVDADDCTVEIWNVAGEELRHERTIPMPAGHGSLTWIDRRSDGSWWMCYAVYGRTLNRKTKLVKYRYEDGAFVEEGSWTFPEAVSSRWGKMSSSGGSWGADGYLYTTGHDGARAYVLELDTASVLRYVRTETNVGFSGQGIAWDRSSEEPTLWGINRRKGVSETWISGLE
jgi:hypothetical protein